jgi:cytochrome c-type biogenesis protein CcmH/NrfF
MSFRGDPYEKNKFHLLYRIVRCLDCLEMPTRGDNDCMSLMTTESDINNEIKRKIYLLDEKGLTQEQICQELKYMYGNHVISNKRDRYKRTEFDY